jgi:penicillin-binding protein 2
VLGDHAAHRDADDVRVRQPRVVHHGEHVLGHVLHRQRAGGAAGAAGAAVVEGDHAPPGHERRQLNQPWYPGETVITGIGQGYWVTTPLQLAHASAILASGGVARPPHLLRATRPTFDAEIQAIDWPEGVRIIASDSPNLPPVVDSMVAVMHGPTGTARRAAAGATYQIAGKTGTALRVGRSGEQSLNPANMAEHLRHQALFVGFAPAEDPRVAIAVVVEHGGSGSLAAAPIARRILDAWLLREVAWTPR